MFVHRENNLTVFPGTILMLINRK